MGEEFDLNEFEGVAVRDGYLVVRVKADPDPRPSRSGKTLILYSTYGNLRLPDGSRVGINWYRFPSALSPRRRGI